VLSEQIAEEIKTKIKTINKQIFA